MRSKLLRNSSSCGLELHIDCGDDLFVVLDALMGAFRQLLAALDGVSDVLALLNGFGVQDADLFDDLHDFAFGFGERIADLMVHDVDVGLRIFQFVAHGLAPHGDGGQLVLAHAADASEFGNALAGAAPFEELIQEKRNDDQRQEEPDHLGPAGKERFAQQRGQRNVERKDEGEANHGLRQKAIARAAQARGSRSDGTLGVRVVSGPARRSDFEPLIGYRRHALRSRQNFPDDSDQVIARDRFDDPAGGAGPLALIAFGAVALRGESQDG